MLTLVPRPSWPSGDYRAVAVLPVTAAALQDLFGKAPAEGVEDGLGPWKSFGGSLGPERVAIELIEYEWAPHPKGFTLRIDRQGDARAVLQLKLEAMERLAPSQITVPHWLADVSEENL